jgi:mannose-1-phosphate guanylyltransferase/mannose-1-phosphate guanylyltransferase/mannose-6-phosphate isomerase
LASGEYAWNSGIFLLPARKLLDELERLEPELLLTCREAVERAVTDLDFLRLDPEAFGRAKSISIDYAVMERTSAAAVVPVAFPWSDIGAWSALREMGDKDASGTVSLGEVITLDTHDSYVRSEGPLVTTLGVRDLIVVATPDAILITTRDRDQDVKLIVDQLKATGHESATQTQRVHRPWGYYQSIHVGDRFQVKRITVSPARSSRCRSTSTGRSTGWW